MKRKIFAILTASLLCITVISGCAAFKEELKTSLGKLDSSRYFGEWDSSDGYFVFNEDYTFSWYQDNSKSEDNVITGKWSASVFESGQDKTLLPSVTLKREKFVLSGVENTPEEGYPDLELIVMDPEPDEDANSMSLLNSATIQNYELKKIVVE